MAGAATAEVLSPFAGVGFAFPLEVVAERPTTEIPSVEWCDADTISGLRKAREAAEQTAEEIMRVRTDQLCEDPETLEVPNPVDPLTTAGRALAAEKQFGRGSAEAKEAHTSLVTDCQRLLAEAYRKRRWEYFPGLKQTYNDATEDYEYMGYSLSTMVRQGITPMAEKEEQVNRTAEFVEEETARAVRRLGSLAVGNLTLLRPGRPVEAHAEVEARMLTISECPDWAIDAYKRKSKGGWGGYAPEEEKMMIRGIWFAGDGARYQEQLGLPGKLITHDVVNEGLRRLQVIGEGDSPTKEQVRKKQLLNLTGHDVFAFAEMLDSIASEMSGKTVYLGEEVPAGHPRDYAGARLEAEQRQAGQEAQAEELAGFLLGLERAGTDHWVARGIVEKRVHKMVFDGVKGNSEAAAAAFDDKTAERLDEAATLRATGNETAARQVEQQAEKEAPAVSFCGAGSCGLEDGGDSEEAKSMREKLDAESDEDLVRDTERACKNCGKKTLWYSYNSKVVKTACSSCESTHVKKTV
jgi:hypothetical protein